MFDSTQEYIKQEIDKIIGCQSEPSTLPLDSVFKMPIDYLQENVYELDQGISSDLELMHQSDSSGTLHHCLITCDNEFSKTMMQKHCKKYTTNIDFLENSQTVLRNMDKFLETTEPFSTIDHEHFYTIWKDTKKTPRFLERYSYMDWKILQDANNSEFFLQILSIINMSSPILSFIVPFFFLIIPFLIIKLRGIPITFSSYISILKDVAKHHFIGKILNIQNLDVSTALYFMFTLTLYCIQIYQNINACMRFYNNIENINKHLCDLRTFLYNSSHQMKTFTQINENIYHYKDFCNTTNHHMTIINQLLEKLGPICPFYPSFFKITEIGYLLKMYFVIYSDTTFEESLQYSYGFQGYLQHLCEIHHNIENGFISYATFDTSNPTKFNNQYYPKYANDKHIKNSISLSKNIITGPNASGKTTMLKTTALNIIFSQQFGVGFYDSCSLNPYTHIHSYLNIPDTSGRDSLFQAESRRCKEILDSIHNNENQRHFTIFDELYSGTNPTEATKSAYAFLEYLSHFKHVDFVLTTHYNTICEKLGKEDKVVNFKMDVRMNDAGDIKYLYQIIPGISKIEGAIAILKDMNYPQQILDNISKMHNDSSDEESELETP